MDYDTFMMYVLNFFDPTASATAYGRRPKFAMAEQSATAEGENCAYGPTQTDGILYGMALLLSYSHLSNKRAYLLSEKRKYIN